MAKLQTDTPEQMTYSNGLLILTVLGGVRLEGLDRMRVTLKIELPDSPQPPLRHNLDLYNDTQVEKLVRRTAERLETGTSIIAASLSELTQELETYRLQEIKAQATEPQARLLTLGEQEVAAAHLQAANLMEQTIEDLQATGLQGEQDNSMILYLALLFFVFYKTINIKYVLLGFGVSCLGVLFRIHNIEHPSDPVTNRIFAKGAMAWIVYIIGGIYCIFYFSYKIKTTGIW